MSSFSDLPVGVSTFSALRESGQPDVDETTLIGRLCRQPNTVLPTRPRHFGKSLFLSTIASLFQDGLKHFAGLEIASDWSDASYTVVRLDFSEAKDFSDTNKFERKFYEKLEARLKPRASTIHRSLRASLP